ncbi:unnamed protein product [Nesidiocoris tenuis]|uniref:Uncharacterized protein n=1 Tax=Nesidiocoris tenuis TaxID=355587 RepID=A0A6H5FXY1_9HEMI|nr:unnamed protein product [Nesidiocoris tenuis]CAA9994072.1 unnamed protein product [Nesidiocoris tenuis]
MATQYVCGYGLSGVVVGLSAALRSHQYGNYYLTMLWVDVGCLPLLVGSWLSALVNASAHSPIATLGLALVVPAHAGALLVSTAATSAALRRLVLRMAGRKAPPAPPSERPSSSPPPGSERSLELASSHSSDEEASSRRTSTLNSGATTVANGTANGLPPTTRWAQSSGGITYPPQLNIDSELFKAVYATARHNGNYFVLQAHSRIVGLFYELL